MCKGGSPYSFEPVGPAARTLRAGPSLEGPALQGEHYLSRTLLARDEGSLRSQVEAFVHGAPLQQLLALAQTGKPLRLPRVVERSVEGLHKLVSGVFRRAPHAGLRACLWSCGFLNLNVS